MRPLTNRWLRFRQSEGEIIMTTFTQKHKKIERNITLLAVLALVTVAIGGIVEIAPLATPDIRGHRPPRWSPGQAAPPAMTPMPVTVLVAIYLSTPTMVR